MRKEKIILLLSGGLDSVTLAHMLVAQGHAVYALMCNYQQPHVQELTFGKGACRKLGINYTTRDLPPLSGLTDESWVVPFRNDILLGLAVNLAVQKDYSSVAIGCNADDAANFPDCRGGFIAAKQSTVKAAGYKIKILAPFLAMRKSRIAKLADKYGVSLGEIWTCYRGGAEPCGNCPACKKLEEALPGAPITRYGQERFPNTKNQ